MANILLTTGCNLACKYCFAQEKMQGRRVQVLSLEDARKVIAFLKRSNYLIFRAMGGEPTRHPHFAEIVQLALSEGMHIDLLSNATWPASCNELLPHISPSRLFFLLNIDHPDTYRPAQWEKIERNLSAIAGRPSITLSFNIFEKQPRYEYIFDLTNRYDIHTVRLSFSLPVLGAHNTYINLQEYKELAPFVMDFVGQAEAKGVRVQLDNAVPLCIFSYAQIGQLLLNGVLDLKRNARCEPVVDIGPDLTVWCCFCLSKLYNRHLDEFENLDQIEAYYRGLLHHYQGRLFPLDECEQCRYRALWGCQGSCLTYAIMKHGEQLPDPSLAGVTLPHWRQESRLALAEHATLAQYDIPTQSFMLNYPGLGSTLEFGPSFASLFNLLNGQYTFQQIVNEFVQRNSEKQSQSAADDFIQQTMAEGISNMLLGLIQQGIVVTQTHS